MIPVCVRIIVVIMAVQSVVMCSYLCMVLSVVWSKPLTPSSVQQQSSSSDIGTGDISSLPVQDEIEGIYSKVVASNTHDNQLAYQTFSGIKLLPSSSVAKHNSLLSPFSQSPVPHPLLSADIHNKPVERLASFNKKSAQLSDLTSTSKDAEIQIPKVHQQKNVKHAKVKSDALSSTSHTAISDTTGQLEFSQHNSPNFKQSEVSYRTAEGKNSDPSYQEFSIENKTIPTVQLALKNSDTVRTASQQSVSDAILTFATSIAALFSVAVIIGIFGCCCKKKKRSDVNDNAHKNNTELLEKNNTRPKSTVEPDVVINTSDIPTGDKDLDDFTSVKDKIKAFDNSKLVLHPSPDPAMKRKSQNDILQDDKRVSSIVTPQEEVVMRDKTDQSKSKSFGDRISKSDTQDDVSDKIFDNISMESSTISQPHNPDVVIADSDEEDEFAEIQRGTVILKSFQRAKPPRNRSPATRTSKGKIRKSRPVKDSPKERGKSPGRVPSRDPSQDRDHGSTPSSLSVPTSQGAGSKTNNVDKHIDMTTSLTDSFEKQDRTGVSKKVDIMQKSLDSLMVKSMGEVSDFDSIMSKSVTSIGSDRNNKNDSPVSARHRKLKDSPKGDRSGRTDSPARSGKGQEKDLVADKETRNESPNRYKKNKESPHGKRKHRKAERGNNKKEDGLPSDIHEGQEVKDTSAANRLSGLPPNVNNIFYLIDPTVKNKCKSVGDMTDDDSQQNNRKSGDYSKPSKRAKQKEEEKDSSKGDEDAVSPVKRERTQSDPSRKSKLVEKSNI